jgi:hypothetical protein
VSGPIGPVPVARWIGNRCVAPLAQRDSGRGAYLCRSFQKGVEFHPEDEHQPEQVEPERQD